LRGGIFVALALSLPPGSERELVLTTTYLLVVFSILVQGLDHQATEGLFCEESNTFGHDDSRRTSLADHPGESPGGRTTFVPDFFFIVLGVLTACT
jgi:hypothetical protein